MTEENIAEEQEQVEVTQEAKAPEKNDVDHNWQEANRVLKLQQQKIAELENRLNQPPPQAMQEEKDEFADLDPEDYMTVGKAKEMAKKLATKEAAITAKQVVQEYIQQQSLLQDETRMRGKHEDFDYIIEHYAIPMIKNDPALAYRVQNSRNPAETAYKLAKISDEYEEHAMKQPTSAKAEKILKNSSRPVSSNAVGSPLKSQADDFSRMSQAETWAMSQKFARGA